MRDKKNKMTKKKKRDRLKWNSEKETFHRKGRKTRKRKQNQKGRHFDKKQ